MVPRDDSASYLTAFGRAVRGQRGELGLSQEELGFRAELDRTYISGIERGVRNPTLRIVARLARTLKLRPSKLLQLAEAGATEGSRQS